MYSSARIIKLQETSLTCLITGAFGEECPVKLITYGVIILGGSGRVSILSYQNQTKFGLSPITNGKVIDN